MLLGGIEGGGTKFVCAVGTETGDILTSVTIPTTMPAATLEQTIAFFKKQEVLHNQSLAAVGIGSFGPVDLNPQSEHYGYITSTPKPNWGYTNVAGTVQQAFPDIPIGFDTDVNAAALGEHRWGAAQNWDTFMYMTVGTGIGGGAMVSGRLLHGLIHPEMGHVLLRRRDDDPSERGVCPFHDNCLEGLACGPAIKSRWNIPGEQLPPDHAVWDLEADYLAQAMVAFMTTLSPQGIILGGSVMHQQQLFPMIRQKTLALLNNYLRHPVLEHMDEYIVPPGLGDKAGVLGSIALALAAAEDSAR
ncbi:MAG: ROK family protein [Anaerolineae bacterium]|nr:ROK family protein [Anaerolineae bacterium]